MGEEGGFGKFRLLVFARGISGRVVSQLVSSGGG